LANDRRVARNAVGTLQCETQSAAFDRLTEALSLDAKVRPEANECASAWDAELAYGDPNALDARLSRRRDQQLARVEKCAGLDPRLVRLARAALWPECADVVASLPLPSAPPDSSFSDEAFRAALFGHALAARMERSISTTSGAVGATQATLTFDAWLRGPLPVYLERTARQLRALAGDLTHLAPATYGRAVGELALASAWERALMRVQTTNTPVDDLESRQAFQERLVQLLAPYQAEAGQWRLPARAATLVATDWVLLRHWQSKQDYGLAEVPPRLLLAPRSVVEQSRDERLLQRLPAYVAARLFNLTVDGAEVREPLLQALLLRGFDPILRRAVNSRDLSPAEAEAVAHARIVLAGTAFAPEQAREALRVLTTAPPSENARFLHAVATAVSTLPEDARDWATPDSASQAELSALDELANDARVAPALRYSASYDAWLFSSARTKPIGAQAREDTAMQLLEQAGQRFARCIPTGFLSETGCRCPRGLF
jgi:hypothetical protein